MKTTTIAALLLLLLLPSSVSAQLIFPNRGGTGTPTIPTAGQVLVGQGNGTYAPQATSTLGITADLSGITTSDVPEGSNLYYTLSRVQNALLGGYSAVFHSSTSTNATSTNLAVTGTFNFLGTVITNVGTWFAGLFDTNFAGKDTGDLAEGSNLYFTDARARGVISETITGIDYNNSTGILSTSTGYLIPTSASTTEWATAYSWGDHAIEGYLTTVDISDDSNLSEAVPGLELDDDALILSSGYTIPLSASTTERSAAFEWGNHADQGYLSTVDISNDTNLTVTAAGLELASDAVALTSGYKIPLVASTTEWATAFSWGDHSSAGYFDTAGTGLGSTSSTLNLDIDELTDRTAFASGDKLAIYEAGVGIRKIDFDDLPGAGGGLTSLNGLTNASQSFATTSASGLTLGIVSSGSTHTFAPGLSSGYVIPLSASTTEWATAYGWGNHASAGYAPTASPTFTGTVTIPSAFTIGANSFTRSGAHNLTLTTTGATSVTLPTSGTLAALTSAMTGTFDGNNFGGGAIGQGDILYGSTAGTISELTKDTNATRYLSNQGTSNNPSWNQVNLTNGVTGTLPVTNGGTGATSLTGLLLGNGTTAFTATTTLSSSHIQDSYLFNTGDTATGDYTFDTNTLVVDASNDRVGIGTTSAAARLSVQSTGTSDVLNLFETGGEEIVTVLENGNVGIGTNTPARPFHIDGVNTFLRADRESVEYGASWLLTRTESDVIQSSWLFGPTNTSGVTGDDFAIIDYGTAVSGGGTGDPRLVVDKATGNIGLGTVSPQERLHVNGHSLIGPFSSYDDPNTSTSFVHIGDNAVASTTPNGELVLGHVSSATTGDVVGQISFYSSDASADALGKQASIKAITANAIGVSSDLAFFAGSGTENSGSVSERMRITSAGRVGIGTNAPDKLLTVNGNGAQLRLSTVDTNQTDSNSISFEEGTSGSGMNIQYDGTANGMYFQELNDAGSNTNLLTILRSGNVGIGDTSPSAMLTVGSGDLFQVNSSGAIAAITGVSGATGTWNLSAATVKQRTYKSFTWPGAATTTSATTTVPLGTAYTAEAWGGADCWVTSGSGAFIFTDGTNRMNGATATSTVSRTTLSTNNTFTAGERRYVEIGPLTAAQMSCTAEITVNN